MKLNLGFAALDCDYQHGDGKSSCEKYTVGQEKEVIWVLGMPSQLRPTGQIFISCFILFHTKGYFGEEESRNVEIERLLKFSQSLF